MTHLKKRILNPGYVKKWVSYDKSSMKMFEINVLVYIDVG